MACSYRRCLRMRLSPMLFCSLSVLSFAVGWLLECLVSRLQALIRNRSGRDRGELLAKNPKLFSRFGIDCIRHHAVSPRRVSGFPTGRGIDRLQRGDVVVLAIDAAHP